jgi:WD40 repeat protein
MVRWHHVFAVFAFLLLLSGRTFAQQVAISARSPDNARVASAKNKVIDIFDTRTNKQLISIRGHTTDITALIYTPDGKMLASADKAGIVALFDAATGKQIIKIRANPGITGLGFSADGTKLTARAPGGARTFELATGKEVP